jgi:uncharacterized membrane protein
MGLWCVMDDLLLAVLVGLMAIGLSLVLWSAMLRVSPRCRALQAQWARAVLRRRYVAGEIGCGEFWHRMSQYPQYPQE